MKRTVNFVAALILSAGPAFSQIVVDSIDDDGAAGDCELREAITNANFDDQSGSTDCAAGVGDDVIDATGISGRIELTGSLPTINGVLTLNGPGADQLTIDANRLGRVVQINVESVVEINGVTMTGGGGGFNGAGIRNEGRLTLDHVVITDNIGDYGAGIVNVPLSPYSANRGVLFVNNSEISNNRSESITTGNGGGINNSPEGIVTIVNSTISGNKSYVGGGIINWDSLTVINSTISGNEGYNSGGGISMSTTSSSLVMEHSTVTNNSGSGIRISYSPGVDTSFVSLYSSIVAGNDQDIFGPVTETRGYNILGKNSGSTGLVDGVNGDQVGTGGSPLDARLFDLADFGGPTKTHLPKPDSPALDNGSCSLSAVSADQRGTLRAQDLPDGTYPNADDGCDVGAVENKTNELESGVGFIGVAILEGAYDGAGGNSVALNGSLPLTQPYSDAMFDGTVLDYDGSESVGAMPTDVVDWLLVSLRSSVDPESTLPSSIQPAFLTKKGYILGLDEDTLRFDVPPMPYYVVVRHRNHLSIMTPNPIAEFEDGYGEWDFTSSDSQAYTEGPDAMKEVDTSLFGMFAADGSADGFITAPDFNLWNAATSAGATGYVQSDYNLDGNVTAPDFNLWNANTSAGAASQVPD